MGLQVVARPLSHHCRGTSVPFDKKKAVSSESRGLFVRSTTIRSVNLFVQKTLVEIDRATIPFDPLLTEMVPVSASSIRFVQRLALYI